MRTSKLLLTGICTSAVGIGLAVGTARADEMDELKAQVRALKATLEAVQKRQQAIEARQVARPGAAPAVGPGIPTKAAVAAPVDPYPGYLLIPGSQTMIKFGGYVKLDSIYDVKGRMNGISSTLGDIPLNGTPLSKRNPDFQFSARESRFNIGTLTPTSMGDLKTFIEADFYGTGGNTVQSNSYGLRLRQAYMSVGPWLAGQTWSTFLDLDTYPETLDFTGPSGLVFARQALVRYTTALGPGALSLAAENPFSDFQGSDSPWPSDNSIAYAPDVVAKWAYDPSWGHVAVSGMAREIALDTGGATINGENGKASTFGWGALVGVAIKTVGKDLLQMQGAGGFGIGRYIDNNGADDHFQGASLNADGSLRATPAYGVTVGYLHYWTDWIRSTVAYGRTYYDGELPSDPVHSVRSIDSVHANLIFSPLPHTDIGIEYIFGHIKFDSFDPATGATGPEGTAHRIQTSAKVSF
jgi:DcaP outer membrane protein